MSAAKRGKHAKRPERAGRASGLAVAVGLGVAVVTTGHGVASATTGENSTSGSPDTDGGSKSNTTTDSGTTTSGATGTSGATTGTESEHPSTSTSTSTTTTSTTLSGSQTTTTTTSGDGPTTSVSASGGSGTTVSTVPHENSSTPTPPQAAAEPTTEKPKPQEHDQTPSETTTPTPEETPATDDKQKSAQAVVGEKAAVTQPETGETVTAAAQTAEPKTAQTVVGPLARTTVATTAVTPPTFGLPTVTLPPYPTIPGVSPTRVAVAVVVVLGRALQTALSGPIPNPIAIPIYMVLVAAYQRLTEIALNHVPVVTQPTPALQVPVLGTITGTLVATDPDGDPLTFTYTQPTNGGLVVVTNVPLTNQYAYVYTPPLLGGGGPNSFTVTFDDTGVGDHFYAPNGHTTSYTVSLDVPTATVGPRDSIGVVRGGFAGGSVDGRTYSLANGNTAGATATSAFTTLGGIVSLNTTTGDWTYIPAVSGHNILGIPDNTDSFVVTVDDGVHGAVQTTVSVGADLGIAVTGANTNTSNGAYSGSLDIPVGDNGLLTYSVGTGPSSKGSVFVTSTGGFIYTPTPQARHAAAAANATAADKTDTFTIKGTDANGRSITVTTVSVNILPANSAPAGGTATFPAANANGVITGSVTGITDADGDTLTYTGTAGKGTVTFNGTTFTYTPTLDARHAAAADNAGTAIKQDTITITVDDGHGGTATFSSGAFNVTPQNTAPAYTNVGKSSGGVLGLTKTWTVNGMIDADDDTLTLAVTSLPSGGLLNLPVILGNTVTLVSLLTESGKTFVVTMSDGHGGKVPITLTI